MADDHPIVLAGMKGLLAAEADMEVVAEATNGLDALTMIADKKPDIAVLDMSMPILGGMGVARRLQESGPPCKIIALTVHEEAAYLHQVQALGMVGYVLKRSATDDLVRAIRIVRAGGVYFDRSIRSQFVDAAGETNRTAPAAPAVALTRDEMEVLKMVALGYSNRAISDKLMLDLTMVDAGKSHAMDKLHLRSRIDIVRYATDNGWLKPNSSE